MASEPDNQGVALVDVGDIYRAHAPALRRFALYLSGDPALADDLVSDAFVRLWTARERVEMPTVRGYLFVIVRNLFLKHRRRAGQQALLDENLADASPGPEDRARGSSDLRVVMEALATLGDVDRAAVLWVVYWRMARRLSAS